MLDVACIPHPRVQLLEEDETRCAFINLQFDINNLHNASTRMRWNRISVQINHYATTALISPPTPPSAKYLC
jgi:hypothetical protein